VGVRVKFRPPTDTAMSGSDGSDPHGMVYSLGFTNGVAPTALASAATSAVGPAISDVPVSNTALVTVVMGRPPRYSPPRATSQYVSEVSGT
jgi:hypothetical protein